jgi:hypothetical protein
MQDWASQCGSQAPLADSILRNQEYWELGSDIIDNKFAMKRLTCFALLACGAGGLTGSASIFWIAHKPDA